MNSNFVSAAAIAAAPAVAPGISQSDAGKALVAAAKLLLSELERGRAIDARALRTAMVASFGGSDAEGTWDWKTAYDACEAAQILFLRKFGPAMRERAASPSAFLANLTKLAALLPSHTRRSEESQALQQFSTPIALGFAAATAAAITPADLVLEPSAGTGTPRRPSASAAAGSWAMAPVPVAGILLDNWLKGRRRALWVSKSDKLIEDAQRDWSALGRERLLVTPLSRFRQGTPIRLDEGILFTTYATLRSDAREEKVSRVRQIVDWLGRDFDGVIVFDESHAMQNAGGGKSERGDQAPSQQGRALTHGFPTQLFEPFTDGDGNLSPARCFATASRCNAAMPRNAGTG
jgi:P-loop containing NTP hydrolase pore-1